ncbi:M23 family metallopeptidase [Acaryochloris sp. IP29b_bin.148]|uniref:M23 family metallopeptidase n=1 Tax=Acaryochloris sp. IP29b_bin.148 TaxID=2969218 RepID=UPI0034532DB0
MKREIPQKIDTVLSGVSTLLRRTRSASVLGFMITVSALGGLITEQSAHAVASTHFNSSARQPLQLPDLIGSSRYKVSTYQARNTSKRSTFLRDKVSQRKAILVASKSEQIEQPTPFATQPGSPLAVKTATTQPKTLSTAQLNEVEVSFPRRHWVGSSQGLVSDLGTPLVSEHLFKSIDLLDLGNNLELGTSDILDSVAIKTRVAEPILLAGSPQQSLLNLDTALPQSLGSEEVSESGSLLTHPLNLSAALEDSPDASEPKNNSPKVPQPTSVDTEEALAVLPDIDLSQTIIPNDRNSALIDSGAIVHQVKPGESLEDIARLYQVSANEIAKANRVSDPSSVGPQTKLRIPAHQSLSLSLSTVQDIVALNDAEASDQASGLTGKRDQNVKAKDKVAAKDTRKPSAPLAVLPPQPASETQLNRRQNIVATRNLLPQVPSLELPPLSSVDRYLPSQMLPGPQKYVWPAKGVLTSGFGWRWGRPHRGIDIAAPVGTPVVAAAPGVVKTAGWNRWGYGNLVEIRHPDGSLTLYAHNHRIRTRVGESVSQGQQIADMGSTGRSTGPHTHFELHPAGKGAINPVPLLRKL